MLERYKQFEIKNPTVIYGGSGNNRDHHDDAGVPPDGFLVINFTTTIGKDHGDNDGIPPDDARR